MLEEIKKEFIEKHRFLVKKIKGRFGTVHYQLGHIVGDYYNQNNQNKIFDSEEEALNSIWQFIEQKLTEAIRQAKIVDYLEKQKEWSSNTFGNGKRTLGIIKHIQKELIEIEECPEDLQEWIDVIILAMDGYWRHGGNPKDLMGKLVEKQCIDFSRNYPFPTSENEPSEHIRINELKGDE